MIIPWATSIFTELKWKIHELCARFWLTAEALYSLKNIRECRNPVQLLRAASHLLYMYYIFNRVSLIFKPSPWKMSQRRKKSSQDHQAGQQLARPDGKSKDALENQDLTFGWAFRPGWAWSSLCGEDFLGLPVAGILSPQERALGGISMLRRVTEASCNLIYEFDPNLLCRFIPLELKERYSNPLLMAATLSLLRVTR